MNENFKTGESFFDNGNYKKALECFRSIKEDDEFYEYALIYQIYCLIELKEYRSALKIINPLIEKTPYSELLWSNKVTCHICLKEDDKALKALGEVERIIDINDKSKLLSVARWYNMLNEFKKANIYCDKALSIDSTYKEALFEKALVAIGVDDDEMINKTADAFLETCDDKLLSVIPVFLLKLFSKNYSQALNIIEKCSWGDFNPDYMDLFKSVVYKRICDDRDINILIAEGEEITIDEVLEVLFDYIDNSTTSGSIRGIPFVIINV